MHFRSAAISRVLYSHFFDAPYMELRRVRSKRPKYKKYSMLGSVLPVFVAPQPYDRYG
jgi:hypothetical protein